MDVIKYNGAASILNAPYHPATSAVTLLSVPKAQGTRMKGQAVRRSAVSGGNFSLIFWARTMRTELALAICHTIRL